VEEQVALRHVLAEVALHHAGVDEVFEEGGGSGAEPPVAALARAAVQARIALSAPVQLVLGATRWVVPRYRLAQLIELPSGGRC